jgi:hypothetical protein
MYLQVISLKTAAQPNTFDAVVAMDTLQRTFQVTVHDEDIRYLSFEAELENILLGNPSGRKQFANLIFTLYAGGTVKLPVDLGLFGAPIAYAG